MYKVGSLGMRLYRYVALYNVPIYMHNINSCMSSGGKEMWHYDVKVWPTNECVFNNYTFTSLPDAIKFYTDNRLGSVFLIEPVSQH